MLSPNVKRGPRVWKQCAQRRGPVRKVAVSAVVLRSEEERRGGEGGWTMTAQREENQAFENRPGPYHCSLPPENGWGQASIQRLRRRLRHAL